MTDESYEDQRDKARDAAYNSLGKAFEDSIEENKDMAVPPEVSTDKYKAYCQQGIPVTGEDNWANRDISMKCRTCMWFVAKPGEGWGEGSLGRCRRHAPTINGWPAVFQTDWCGDHKVDENKL